MKPTKREANVTAICCHCRRSIFKIPDMFEEWRHHDDGAARCKNLSPNMAHPKSNQDPSPEQGSLRAARRALQER